MGGTLHLSYVHVELSVALTIRPGSVSSDPFLALLLLSQCPNGGWSWQSAFTKLLGLASWKHWGETGAQEEERSQMLALSFDATGVSDSCCVLSVVLAPARQALHNSMLYSLTQRPESLGSSNTGSYFCPCSPEHLVASFVLADLPDASLFPGWLLTLSSIN